MPAKTMSEQIQSLDAALRTRVPDAKGPVPAAKAVTKIESLTGLLDADVRALWAWGLAPQVFGDGELGMDGENVWLSAEESASHLKDLRIAPEFPESFVPLSTDEAGNFACFDAATKRMMDWDHETRKTRLLSKSLAGYLDPRRVKVERAVRELALAAKEKATPKVAPSPTAVPRGIRRMTSAHLTRFDAKGYGGGAESAAMSLDGRWIAFGFSGSSVLFDGQTEELVEFEGRLDSSPLLAFDPTTARFLRGDSSCGVEIIDVDGTTTHRWEVESMEPMRGGFSPDGSLVYRLTDSEGLDVWRVADLPNAEASGESEEVKPLARLAPEEPSGYCTDVGVANDGTMLLLRDVDSYQNFELTLWEPTTGKVLARRVHPSWSSAVALSPDGTRAAVGMHSGDIVFISRDGLELGAVIEKAHSDEVFQMKYDPSGRLLVSSGAGELKVWDAITGKVIGAVPAKSKNNAPKLQVSTVTPTHVLTCEPLALFEFLF